MISAGCDPRPGPPRSEGTRSWDPLWPDQDLIDADEDSGPKIMTNINPGVSEAGRKKMDKKALLYNMALAVFMEKQALIVGRAPKNAYQWTMGPPQVDLPRMPKLPVVNSPRMPKVPKVNAPANYDVFQRNERSLNKRFGGKPKVKVQESKPSGTKTPAKTPLHKVDNPRAPTADQMMSKLKSMGWTKEKGMKGIPDKPLGKVEALS